MISAPSGVLVLGSEQLEIPEDLPSPLPGTGEVVLLLADSDTSQSGWAARVAIALSRHWASSGLQVILADGDLPRAPLHGEVGVENEEGVADLLLYGSSPYRVTRRVEGEEFLLITAGTVVADPEKVFRHDRWKGLLAAFRESGCILVLYLPSDQIGHEALLPEGDRVLRLCESSYSEVPEPGVLVLVPAKRAEEPQPVLSEVPEELIQLEVEEDESASLLPQAVEEVEQEARVAAAQRDTSIAAVEAPALAAHAATEAKTASTVPVATRKGPWILLIVLIGVGILLALGWLGYLPFPGSSAGTSWVPGSGSQFSSLTLFTSRG